MSTIEATDTIDFSPCRVTEEKGRGLLLNLSMQLDISTLSEYVVIARRGDPQALDEYSGKQIGKRTKCAIRIFRFMLEWPGEPWICC